RRRHTRWPRDWSSDVCSSDLCSCRRRLSFTQNRCHAPRAGSPGLAYDHLVNWILKDGAQLRLRESTILKGGVVLAQPERGEPLTPLSANIQSSSTVEHMLWNMF